MPAFSQKSLDKLQTCDNRLVRLFLRVVTDFDCTVLQGHRGQVEQDAAYAAGKSQLKWPDGKHNAIPSKAVDVAPYPVDWDDRDRFHYFGGYVLGVAHEMGINIRWGGDWDSDRETRDNSFDDLVHFEVVD